VILTHLVMFGFFDGAGQAAEPPAPSTFNNAIQNWMSPTPHLVLLLGLSLWALGRLSP
jgi:hypothetical protein